MALVVAIVFVMLGACILAGALVPARRLLARQTSGRRRLGWLALAASMAVLILGCIGCASIRWDADTRLSDLGVPLMCFGACLVVAVSALALACTQFVRRLAVLENENIIDPLTGIPNYRHFIARLNEEVARSNRYHPPLALIMVEIDDFEKISDTYGVAAGDLVLTALARLMLSVARDADITARYGREQIAVAAPNTTTDDAVRFAQRIRQAVEAASLLPAQVSAADDAPGVTVSIGVSSLGPHIRDAQALTAGANAALLECKARRAKSYRCGLKSVPKQQGRPSRLLVLGSRRMDLIQGGTHSR
jgi:diguanylate cyclase (GGDEF)-like protein